MKLKKISLIGIFSAILLINLSFVSANQLSISSWTLIGDYTFSIDTNTGQPYTITTSNPPEGVKITLESDNPVDFLIVNETQFNDRVGLIMDSHYRENQTTSGTYYWNLLNTSLWRFVLLNQDYSNNVANGSIQIYTNPAIIIMEFLPIYVYYNITKYVITTEYVNVTEYVTVPEYVTVLEYVTVPEYITIIETIDNTEYITEYVNVTRYITKTDTESIEESNNNTNGFLLFPVILMLVVIRKRRKK